MGKMRNTLYTAFLILILFLSAGNRCFAENRLRVEVLPKVVKQGGVCLIRTSGPRSLHSIAGEFRGDKIPMALELRSKTYEGFLGIDMDVRPGKYPIRLRAKGENDKIYGGGSFLEVKKVDFKTQTLKLPPGMVELDPKTLEGSFPPAGARANLYRFWAAPSHQPSDEKSPFRGGYAGRRGDPHTCQ